MAAAKGVINLNSSGEINFLVFNKNSLTFRLLKNSKKKKNNPKSGIPESYQISESI